MAELLKRRTIRATDEQMSKWRKLAEKAHLSLNAWIRRQCDRPKG